jgi:hypothetical protein
MFVLNFIGTRSPKEMASKGRSDETKGEETAHPK